MVPCYCLLEWVWGCMLTTYRSYALPLDRVWTGFGAVCWQPTGLMRQLGTLTIKSRWIPATYQAKKPGKTCIFQAQVVNVPRCSTSSFKGNPWSSSGPHAPPKNIPKACDLRTGQWGWLNPHEFMSSSSSSSSRSPAIQTKVIADKHIKKKTRPNDNDQNRPAFPLGQRLGQVATVCQGRDDQPRVSGWISLVIWPAKMAKMEDLYGFMGCIWDIKVDIQPTYCRNCP